MLRHELKHELLRLHFVRTEAKFAVEFCTLCAQKDSKVAVGIVLLTRPSAAYEPSKLRMNIRSSFSPVEDFAY